MSSPGSPDPIARVREALETSPAVMAVLERLDGLGVPDCWLTAGCLVQTVWNHVTGRPPTYGIDDYDIDYFDDHDLSWEAEDAVIRRGRDLFADLGVTVQIVNEARVPLWYEAKFGVACPAYRCTTDAVDTFPALSSCLAARLVEGDFELYAPHGLGDVVGLVVRPNPRLALRAVYEAKTGRWARLWPELTVHPWPG